MARTATRKSPPPPAKITGKKPRAKAQALPGMEDHAIKPLEEIAEQYVEIRDQRMELTESEHTLKINALKLMKKYGKTVYRHNGVEILVITGEDDVKVRVRKGDDTAADLDLDEPAPDSDGVRIGDVEQTEERRNAVDSDTGE
jgi:hypothetical protein